MMIGSKMFQDEFMKINNILSGIRNKDICPEVNLYKTLCGGCFYFFISNLLNVS